MSGWLVLCFSLFNDWTGLISLMTYYSCHLRIALLKTLQFYHYYYYHLGAITAYNPCKHTPSPACLLNLMWFYSPFLGHGLVIRSEFLDLGISWVYRLVKKICRWDSWTKFSYKSSMSSVKDLPLKQNSPTHSGVSVSSFMICILLHGKKFSSGMILMWEAML